MDLYEIKQKGENSLVTLQKAENKFIFDKNWQEDITRIQEDHYKQMALLLNYADKIATKSNLQ